MSKPPRILIANDDGIFSQGINKLIEVASGLGEVWVVAPDRERSATSHSISLHKPLRLREVGNRRFCIDGTPTDSVYMALHHLLPEPPRVVLSGINHGPNLGNDVIYSGTVSAAMEGALYGIPAVAFSLCSSEGRAAADCHFDTAAEVAALVARDVIERPLPRGVLLNVNVPNVPRADVRGLKLTRLGFTAWNETVTERRDPRDRPYFWIGGNRLGEDDLTPDADNSAVARNLVSITPVHYDLTDFRAFDYVRKLRTPGLARVADTLGDGPVAPHTKPI